jgi:hypothetical protein
MIMGFGEGREKKKTCDNYIWGPFCMESSQLCFGMLLSIRFWDFGHTLCCAIDSLL